MRSSKILATVLALVGAFSATFADAQRLRPGRGPGFRPGFVFVGGSQAVAYGTSATRYSIAASRFRTPTIPRTVSGSNNYLIGQFIFGSPDYAITNPRFFFPSWYQGVSGGSSPETAIGNTITIEGVSILIGGAWYQAPPASFPITIDPSTSAGALLPAITGVTIPAGTTVTARVAYNVPAGGQLPTVARNGFLGETIEGSTSSLAAKLTNGVAVSTVGGHSDAYQPLYMVAQGGDGRPAAVIMGDSIGFGANDNGVFNSTASQWTSRGAFGYLMRGLDDNSTSKRIMAVNLCVPGSRPADITSRDSNWSKKKFDSLKVVYDTYGAWPFDEAIWQHGQNSVGGITYDQLIAATKVDANILKAEWGKPITAVELLPRPSSTDGYATFANQTPTAATDAYPNGIRWKYNAAIGTDGNPDATTEFRAGGYFQDSFAPWRASAYDLGSNRDRLKVLTFTTTLASAAAQNATTLSLTASPAPGDYLAIGGQSADGLVISVSGTGPYSAVMNMTSNVPSGGLAAGTTVNAKLHDGPGTHPGTVAHRDYYAPVVIAWKQRRGWQ